MLESKWTGLLGVVGILATAFLMSNNRKKINYRLVVSGLVLQLLLAIFVLKLSWAAMFRSIGDGITELLHFSDAGAGFVFGPLVTKPDELVRLSDRARTIYLPFASFRPLSLYRVWSASRIISASCRGLCKW